MRTTRTIQLALTCIALWFAVPAVDAQTVELRGVVRDSASAAPVGGTVVLALDGIGTTVARTISNSRGQYQLSAPRGTLLVRAVRIGYRAATERIPLAEGQSAAAQSMTIDLVIASVPLQLQTVAIAGARGCPVRDDQAQASSLLEHARAGLLATVVARERQPAQLVVLRYDRELDLDGIGIEQQRMIVDSSANLQT